MKYLFNLMNLINNKPRIYRKLLILEGEAHFYNKINRNHFT